MSYKVKADLLAVRGALPVGCRICGGQLLPALSPVSRKGSVPQNIIFAGYAEGAGRYFICTPSTAYISGNGDSFIQLDDIEGSTPFLVEEICDGAPRAALICGGLALTHTGSKYKAFSYGANLRCGVMHCGRLFGADGDDGYKLCWSGEGGIGDWEEGLYASGSLVLDPEKGIILDILEYGEKLVAVRKYGLSVFSMFGTPENFSAEIGGADTDEIYGGTASIVDGKIIFCTASGLKVFDGSCVKQLEHGFCGDIYSPLCSAVFAGRYYLSCQSKSLGGGAVLCVGADGEGSYLIDISADGLCSAGRLCVYNSTGAYRLEEGGQYSFTSGAINFGTDGFKTVKKIFIDGQADLEISNGRVVRAFKGAKGVVRPNLRGKEFIVKLTGNKPVYGLTARAEVQNAI